MRPSRVMGEAPEHLPPSSESSLAQVLYHFLVPATMKWSHEDHARGSQFDPPKQHHPPHPIFHSTTLELL